MALCIGIAIYRKEESRSYGCLVTKDGGEVEHGDAVLCQSFLQGMLEVGHSVAKQWEIGFFLTRLEHDEDIRALLLRPRLQTLQRLQYQVEGMLVRLRFGTRCFELLPGNRWSHTPSRQRKWVTRAPEDPTI